MDDTPSPDRPRPRWGRAAGLIAAGVIAGGVLAGTVAAGAQSNTSSSSSSDPSMSTGTHRGNHAGPGETLLTGTTAQRVRAAALAAVPGGTVIRVETDSDGSPYEAHITKADGTEVTVKIDKAFKVTAVQAGHGQPSQSA